MRLPNHSSRPLPVLQPSCRLRALSLLFLENGYLTPVVPCPTTAQRTPVEQFPAVPRFFQLSDVTDILKHDGRSRRFALRNNPRTIRENDLAAARRQQVEVLRAHY